MIPLNFHIEMLNAVFLIMEPLKHLLDFIQATVSQEYNSSRTCSQ